VKCKFAPVNDCITVDFRVQVFYYSGGLKKDNRTVILCIGY